MRVLVLVGTTTGRARTVAEVLARRLDGAGAEVAVVPTDRVDVESIVAADAVIVCTSTFGAGGVPLVATDLLAAIAAGALPFADKPVGFVGLGDRSFARTYNGGWRAFEAALLAHGAVRIGEPLLFDAADMLSPEEEAARRDERVTAWAAAFLAALAAHRGDRS